uniref:Uncharacterized protein n=1 Tax=Micrurus spixii TaxID=129469 RepID=A0A2D4N9M6_9SAUR
MQELEKSLGCPSSLWFCFFRITTVKDQIQKALPLKTGDPPKRATLLLLFFCMWQMENTQESKISGLGRWEEFCLALEKAFAWLIQRASVILECQFPINFDHRMMANFHNIWL